MKETLPHLHRLTVEEYYRMAEVGLLAPDARTELIEGVIIDMAPIGNPHMGVVDRLAFRLQRIAGDRVFVRSQGAVRLSNYSLPQPDIALLIKHDEYYYDSHDATPADVPLIVEVSDTTLHYDRKRKVPLYARHGIPEVWIADVKARQLHVFRSRSGLQYKEMFTAEKPGMMELCALQEMIVDLTGLFAPS